MLSQRLHRYVQPSMLNACVVRPQQNRATGLTTAAVWKLAPGSTASTKLPSRVPVHTAGNLYVTDWKGTFRVLKVPPSW
ncbi:hypothetical protein [Mycobacterium sp.]|uniref:hypothetical protein n=1 Tax=Mycobacterium sp. TaxID=1785 RepID=UPI003F9CA859